jgi:RNA polymerase sigma-70 factor (ECF subfamily)
MPPSKVHPVIELPFPATLPADDPASSRAAQEEVLFLFDACALGLRRYVGSFGLGEVATDDILQDVFLSLFRHLSLGRPRHNLKGWLFRVAHNLALKHRQKTARRLRTEGEWNATLVDHVIDPAADPEQQLSDGRRRLRLRKVLRAMPERDRQCMYLRTEGLCYRDIARTLGISLGSVAKSLTRALARLTNADLE